MLNEFDQFYESQSEPNRSCLLALRSIILGVNQAMKETRKYGMPCFCFGKKILVYLWTDKKTNEPYILFADGNKIDHPQLEVGNRSRMKIYRVEAKKDLPIKQIEELLVTALNLVKI